MSKRLRLRSATTISTREAAYSISWTMSLTLSGTIHARATVCEFRSGFDSWLFARVRLVVAPPSPTLLVPDSAVLPGQSQHMVMTVSADAGSRQSGWK